MSHHKVIIIGSGPAGLTSAIYCGRADLSPLVIAGESYGGQLMLTTEVENYPGFPNGVMGPELMENMITQAKKFGAELIYKFATAINVSSSPYSVSCGDTIYTADSIIVATGAKPKWLGIGNEMDLVGKGVSTCATCDAAFFRGKSVAVIGGGDTAMEDSTYLTKFADKVTIIHRRDEFRASKVMQAKVFTNPKISVLWSTVPKEFIVDSTSGKLSALKVQDVKTEKEIDLKFDGVFVAIGHEPQTNIFKDVLELDENGYVKAVDGKVRTSVEGVFVCGDAEDHRYRQAIVAAGAGCMAAMEVESYLAK